MIKTFYCFRHGQTDWNKEGKFQGCGIDLSLNEIGRNQALDIPHFPIDIIYSSPLKRALETAEIYNKNLGVQIIIEPGLKELNYGDWAGITKEQIKEKYGEECWYKYNSPKDEDESFKIPGGDIKKEVIDRGVVVLEKIGAETDFPNVGIFAHGRILSLIANKLSKSDKRIPILKNSEYIQITYDTETKELTLVEDDKI